MSVPTSGTHRFVIWSVPIGGEEFNLFFFPHLLLATDISDRADPRANALDMDSRTEPGVDTSFCSQKLVATLEPTAFHRHNVS